MRIISYLSICLCLAFFAGCGDDHAGHDHGAEAHDHDAHAGHDHADHEGHDHGDHAGHDHGAEGHSHDAHGKEQQLGEVKAGDFTFNAIQFGDVVGQSEAVFTLTYAQSPAPELRLWIGNEDGRGSVKALLSYDKEQKHYHGHVEVPGALPEGAAVWLEATADGKTSRGHIAFK